MRRPRGFTIVELVLAAALFAGVVAIALAWLLAQQRFAGATGRLLEDATHRPPLVTLLRQDVQAAGQVLPAWRGLASDEHTLILGLPRDAYGYRTDRAAVVLYTRTGTRLLRAAFPDRQSETAEAASRWIGPELKRGQEVTFSYLDGEGLTLIGEAVAGTRMVVVELPAEAGQPAAELRLELRNTLP